MKCTKATNLVQLSIDNQLKIDQCCALEAHLTDCQTCRQESRFFKEITMILKTTALIAEPADLTANIMKRVANQQQAAKLQYDRQALQAAFRPSWQDLCAAVLLATLAMLGIIAQQPTLRAALPIANSYNNISQFCIHTWNNLLSTNSGTLLFALWIIGALLGIWITLTLVGSEMRSTWLRAVIDRLPTW